jgi:hypothetical protein
MWQYWRNSSHSRARGCIYSGRERESYENIIQNNNLIKIYNDLESEVYIYI